jgi:hypothetical protein
MSTPHCPGQDSQHWKPEDIFNVACPFCGEQIEFWKDEPVRRCPACKRDVRNPKVDLGCAQWCRHSDECLGQLSPEPADPSPPPAPPPE